jgi:hypothetical protein
MMKTAFSRQMQNSQNDESFKAKLLKSSAVAQRLELTVVSSATLEKGMKIVIGPCGLEGNHMS